MAGFGVRCLPVYLAAATMGVPVVIHEQNALPGLANKVAARFARQVAVSFPDTPLPGADYLGLPVRRGIADLDVAARRAGAAPVSGSTRSGPRCWSRAAPKGAVSINTATLGARAALLAAGIRSCTCSGQNITEADTVVAGEHQPLPAARLRGGDGGGLRGGRPDGCPGRCRHH
ncbi:MAG: glycosyltransferase [Micropruina sp.]